ncbi:flagellar export chaperone FliS [Marinagarivorans algicola]|uniref:flagellar export chaperone FliS n=1 Tax=Marinagarivorans algicola TaxID=1513270 RepID=UPI0006B9526E|nr:flagellar export chaperone FliS [Marinagarivorans algicola]
MAVAQTQAALVMQEQAEQLTSHQVISLLMDGAIERASGVIMAIHSGNDENRQILAAKLKAIINGLRESLDFKLGGTVAENLAALYDYMIERLHATEGYPAEQLEAVTETRRLIAEVKSGWDNMDLQVPDMAQGA